MSDVMSFEFIEGLRLYYRYAENKEIEVLYGQTWINLKDFCAQHYSQAATKDYPEQPNLMQE